jgi:FixJ family two-component response regulator
MRMPVMHGLELLRRMSESDLAIPVIVMTGQGEPALAAQALEAGAIDIIEKPFPAPILFDAILSAFEAIGQPAQTGLATSEISEHGSADSPGARGYGGPRRKQRE